jgi:hypothetical protein
MLTGAHPGAGPSSPAALCMSIQSALPGRLSVIDAGVRGEYSFLTGEDRCLFFGEFRAGTGWSGGSTNDLIADFKRTRSQLASLALGQRLRRHRERAIAAISTNLRRQFSRDEIEARCTFVPIPTSKRSEDPDYCDRLERTLRCAFDGDGADIRLLLRQTVSTLADHHSGAERIDYERLLQITTLDPRYLVTPLRPVVVLFDDVLTTGKHYKVAKTRIRETFPKQQIVGIFVARCVHVHESLVRAAPRL